MKKLLKWGIIFIILLAIIAAIGVYYALSMLEPVDPDYDGDKITVDISGSAKNVSSILKENDLIKNELAFRLYLKYTGEDTKLKAGTFELSKNMDLEEITKELVSGDHAIIETDRFTVIEGWNVKQIAEKLSEDGLVDKERFLQLVKEGNFDYDFVKAIPDNELIEYKLEGYLFPNTYEIKKDATEEEIIERMLSEFDKEWKEEWDTAQEERGLTLHEMVTLASIVEREVVSDKERPIVAGVFYNRMEDSWKLESCATVQFVLGKQKDILTYADLAIENPYNTYLNDGLPPGPIGSPGRKSLQAVVYPEDNDYYFFVTKKDGTGEHHFSKTLSEHSRYDRESRGTGNW